MSSGSAIAFEVLKALRQEPMSRHALVKALGGDWYGINRAVQEGERNGVLVAEMRGAVKVYRVSQAWGGVA